MLQAVKKDSGTRMSHKVCEIAPGVLCTSLDVLPKKVKQQECHRWVKLSVPGHYLEFERKELTALKHTHFLESMMDTGHMYPLAKECGTGEQSQKNIGDCQLGQKCEILSNKSYWILEFSIPNALQAWSVHMNKIDGSPDIRGVKIRG